MKAYRILNCPCYDADYEECLNTPRDEYIYCHCIDNCLIKQIVEKSKNKDEILDLLAWEECE